MRPGGRGALGEGPGGTLAGLGGVVRSGGAWLMQSFFIFDLLSVQGLFSRSSRVNGILVSQRRLDRVIFSVKSTHKYLNLTPILKSIKALRV